MFKRSTAATAPCPRASESWTLLLGRAALCASLFPLGCGDPVPDAAADPTQAEPTQAEPAASVPEHPFAELSGPYEVGVRDLFYVDDRPEPFTADPDDQRRLLVRVWYPASANAEDVLAPYVPDAAEFDGAETFAGVLHVRTRGFANAAPHTVGGPYPVLLFNPGGGWTRLSDTFWTEQLASHGYVVFAVDHQGFNQSVVFPDDTRFVADQLAFPAPSGDLEADALASWAHLEEHHFPLWLADNASLLNHIEAMAGDPNDNLGRLLDTSHMGAFGWSFGGALAVQLSRDDPRIQAAIDGDGQLFGDVARTGTATPVLLLHGEPDAVAPEQQEVLERLMAEVEANFAELRERSPLVWEMTLRGASHGSFSDLVLASAPPPGGPADHLAAARGHEIITALSVAFFDRHLKGETGSLLDDPEGQFEEVVNVRRSGMLLPKGK